MTKLPFGNSSRALLVTLLSLGAAACSGVGEDAGVGTTAAAATAVQVVDLGTLPGGTYSTARAINNLGQIAGMSSDAAPLTGNKQVIWSGGTITSITPCCGGGYAVPQAINDSREVVAWENGGYATSAIYWDPSGAVFILPPLAGGVWAQAYDINNSGLVVGQSRDSSGLDRHAVVWSQKALVRDLGVMAAPDPGFAGYSSARGVNDLGDVVGVGALGASYHAFLWRNGSFTDLGLGEAVDVSNGGLVAGNQSGIPWVWQNGVRSNLPGLAGEPVAYGHVVTALNNTGDVVGYAPSSGPGVFNTAVLWRGGKAINLGFYPGGNNSTAYGINDSGQVVGEGNLVPGGPMHALLWTVGGAGATTSTTPAVTLAATSSTSIRPGGSVAFRGSFTDPDSGPWSYTFDWGNGITSGTAASPGAIPATRTYGTSGRYRVTLRVTDAKGATGTSAAFTVRVR